MDSGVRKPTAGTYATDKIKIPPILEISVQTLDSKHKTSKRYKEIPVQAWTGPEGSRRLKFPDFEKIVTES
jgi:hypothetical protein